MPVEFLADLADLVKVAASGRRRSMSLVSITQQRFAASFAAKSTKSTSVKATKRWAQISRSAGKTRLTSKSLSECMSRKGDEMKTYGIPLPSHRLFHLSCPEDKYIKGVRERHKPMPGQRCEVDLRVLDNPRDTAPIILAAGVGDEESWNMRVPSHCAHSLLRLKCDLQLLLATHVSS